MFFFDYGNGFDDNEPVWFDKLRAGAGFEARWISPFGLLRRRTESISIHVRPSGWGL